MDLEERNLEEEEKQKILNSMKKLSDDYTINTDTMLELVGLVKNITEELKDTNPVLVGRIHNKMLSIMERYRSGVSIEKS